MFLITDWYLLSFFEPRYLSQNDRDGIELKFASQYLRLMVWV